MTNVRPRITRDVEKLAECSVDQMLKAFLVRDCSDHDDPPPSLDGTHLFKDSLERVLPICNGEFQAEGVEANSSAVKVHLTAYSEKYKMDEKESYPDFVQAVNTALQCLRSLEVPGIRQAHDSSVICFHVNDPSLLKQNHQDNVSQCKPHVVFVSESDVREAHDLGNDKLLMDKLFQVAVKSPKDPFSWRSVRTFVEFKAYKKKMAIPPESYTCQVDTHSDPQSAEPASSGVSSRPPPPESSSHLDSRKRTSEQLDAHQSQSKRQKVEPKTSHLDIAQAGSYATEMFAAHGGRHVIGLIVVDDLLYLWRYDRQGAIQCSAFNFIQDLPRFLVLLLAMQRFEDRHWGLNPHIDPNFGSCPQSHEMKLRDKQDGDINLTLELSSKERITHFGLNDQATNVFPAASKTLSREDDLVVKVFRAEEARRSEPAILNKVFEIAKENEDVRGHVPDMVVDTSTAMIRKPLGIKIDGARVLHTVVFRRLRPITVLVGDDFLHAWWTTVKCHLSLWQNGVHHRDVSPPNLMFYLKDGKIVGVLNDFDLASTEDGPTGTERTGTVPFMAFNLMLAPLKHTLLKGQIKHLYEHDAESFIWVLIWVALRYDKGVLRSTNRPLEEWLSVDASACREKKCSFLFSTSRDWLPAGVGHERNLEVAKECIGALDSALYLARSGKNPPLAQDSQVDAVSAAFERLLNAPVAPFLSSA